MFKLVAVSGQIRGQEFFLEEGENIFGRSGECSHVIALNGVSKKHMKIVAKGDSIFIEDLGSSNGTFVNDKIIKQQELKKGDKVAIPGVIFQVVYIKQKIVAKQGEVADYPDSDEEGYSEKEVAPNHIVGKVKFFFRTKVMPVIYGFNEQYEWSFLFAIIFVIFIILNIGFTIYPLIQTNKKTLVREVALRAIHYAEEVGRINNVALSRKELDRIDTSFLDNEEGVLSYELFDLKGRIVRPVEKLNSYSNDTFSVETKKWIQSHEKPLVQGLGGDEIGVGGPIIAYNTRTGREEVIGGISIRFAPKSLIAEAASSSQAYFEALVTSLLVAIIFFGFFYYMTIKHIKILQSQIEESLRGKRKEIESPLLMSEMGPLKNTINNLLQRLRELQGGDEDEFGEIEDEAPYLRKLEDFLGGAQGPVLVLDSEKNIYKINSEGEDLLGLRESSASGESLLDTARDQGFAAVVLDLCEQSANNAGCNQKANYDINGVDFEINLAALMGKDNFAKGFYITFVREY